MSHLHNRSVTLVEMVIVLIILLALAGVGISLYPDLALRANLTGSLATLQEINNNFQLVETLTLSMPDNLDLLTDIPTAGGVGMRTEVQFDLEPGGVSPPSTFTPAALASLFDPTLTSITTADVIDAFLTKGVDSFSIYDPLAPVINFTFDFPGAPAGETPLTAATEFYLVDDVTLFSVFNIVADDASSPGPISSVYVLLGVGNRASHVGSPTGLMFAPVYVPDTAKTGSLLTPPLESSTKDFYSRYYVIYKIEAIGVGDVRASFISCTYGHPIDGIGNMSDILRKLLTLDEI